MVGRERKDAHGRRSGADWFIDFEHDDLGAGTVIPQARRRPGQLGPGEPKPDVQPRTKGPSPWVADFLLNQVDGARIEPTIRRKRTSAEGKRGTERNTSARRERAGDGTVMADEPAAPPDHVADDRAATPGPIPRAEPPSPPVTGGAKTGEYGARPYALAGALVLGLAAGLWTLPQGYRRDAAPDGTDAQSIRSATVAKNPDGPPEPREAWRALPLQAVAILQPPRVVSVQAAPAASPVGHRESVALASLIDAPSVSSAAPAAAFMEPTFLPVLVAQVVYPAGPTAMLIGGDVEVTARDGDEPRAVVSGPPSLQDLATGMHAGSASDQVPPAPEAVSKAARKVVAVTEGEPQGERPRHRLRAARPTDRGRQAAKPASSRVAQAAQPRSFALPAALRPTSF